MLGVAVVLPAQPVFAGAEWCPNVKTIKHNSCFKIFSAGSESAEGAPDPFLCRFGTENSAAPVLLAATRDDCTRAGGTVMNETSAEDGARE
jgi:hypothetical protein